MTQIVFLLGGDHVHYYSPTNAPFNWIFHLANYDPKILHLDNPYNNGLDYTCDGDESVLHHLPMCTDQVFLAPVLRLAREVSAGSTSASNIDCIFCCFSCGRYSIRRSTHLRFVEFADESQGEDHRRSSTLRGHYVSYHHTPNISQANRISAGLTVIVRIKYIVDVSLTEDFMFATAVRHLPCTLNATPGQPRLVAPPL